MHEKVYVIVPVYNEEEEILDVLNDLKRYFKNILVVNDGSTDSTSDILELSNVDTLSHLINLGAGAAISSGFEAIKRKKNIKAVITFDADGQHSAEDANDFAHEIISCSEDVIFGSRFIAHSKNIPLIKKIILSIITFITNVITKVKLTDAHNGMNAFKTSCLEKILINIDGFGFATQIVNSVGKNSLSFKEMPTNIKYTDYSIKKGQRILGGLLILEDLYKSRGRK
jgi:polyprenyl-phospho-N-acetylgalactosaminyl synthase